jgi:type VI secretion system secreted protein VgrG
VAAYAQTALQATLSTPLGTDKLLLRSFSGEERISGLFHFELEMRSEDPAVDFSQIVGKSATITLYLSDDGKRYINGLVASFAYAGTVHQPGADQGFAIYHAQLVPWLFMLTQEADSRIFQNKSVPDIAEQLFGDLGFTDFKRSLTGTYDPREYCVQYQETAFGFVSRLFEDEGIFYYFEHADGKHTLVMADDSTAAVACPSGGTLGYGASKTWVQQEVAMSCRLEERVIPGKYAMDDFNFETPSTDLIASVDSTVATDGSKRRIYEYPGGFSKKDKGEARGKLRIEGQEVPAKLLTGDSNSRTVVTGYKFTLSGHPRADVNADWVLSRIVHSGEPGGYGNHFEAFPATVPYRPARTTPKPIIPGTQTAIVTGKSGEEIWTDKYGRVKVQFHWDQLGTNDENSSCWIRVAHGWAGKSWGQIFLPRIGQEVVVSFLEGDPDRPLVTGSVYNAEQTVPYALPAEQTKSTLKSNSSKGGGGSNEIRIEDKKDSEEIYVHGQKDVNIVIEHDRTKNVLNDETITIKNNRTATIQEKDESLTVAKGNRTVKVSTGNESHEVAGTRSVKVTKAETHDDEDAFTHTVAKDYTLTIQGDLSIDVTGAITIKAGKGMILKAGQTLEATAGTALTNKAGTELTNQAGTALTNKAGTDLTNKATTSMTNDGGISLTNKASATQTVDGGGMLTVKGGLVKIN